MISMSHSLEISPPPKSIVLIKARATDQSVVNVRLQETLPRSPWPSPGYVVTFLSDILGPFFSVSFADSSFSAAACQLVGAQAGAPISPIRGLSLGRLCAHTFSYHLGASGSCIYQ